MAPSDDASKNHHASNLESKVDIHDKPDGVHESDEAHELNQFTFTASSLKSPHTLGEIAENVNKNIGNVYSSPPTMGP